MLIFGNAAEKRNFAAFSRLDNTQIKGNVISTGIDHRIKFTFNSIFHAFNTGGMEKGFDFFNLRLLFLNHQRHRPPIPACQRGNQANRAAAIDDYPLILLNFQFVQGVEYASRRFGKTSDIS